MLRDNNLMNRYMDVVNAMGEAVARRLWNISYTCVAVLLPAGIQQRDVRAMEKIADGYGRMVLGYFGRTPVAPDPEVVRYHRNSSGLNRQTVTRLI